MDKPSADKVISEYLPKIYGFSVKKAFGYDEAEDICSEIVAEVYKSLLTGGEVYNLECYIWRICEHVYSKYVSSKKKRLGVSIDGMIIPSFDDYSHIETGEELQRLRREIAFLTKTRREIVYAYYYENKTIAAISRQMNIPAGTVKWHLNKARNELKRGIDMERKIGKLGLKPVKAACFGHSGNPGPNDRDPEYYLGDSLSLNIVYSVYNTPRTKDEIAEEPGVTPVFIEDKIEFLESNGFLVRQAGDKFTTYVKFSPETYSNERDEYTKKRKLEVAKLLSEQYVPSVRAALADFSDVYIPGGNRELFDAAVIFYGISNRCGVDLKIDTSRYFIKTTDGAEYVACVDILDIPCTATDPDYVKTLDLPPYWSCGSMTRQSCKYPSVFSWSVDTRYSSREGHWVNNKTSDYEYIYEYITGAIVDNSSNAEKFSRLRERRFLTDDGKVNIMVAKGDNNEFFSKIPYPDKSLMKKITEYSLEAAEL